MIKLTYDTCAEHHKGNPFLPHYQSATQPANNKTKSLEVAALSRLTVKTITLTLWWLNCCKKILRKRLGHSIMPHISVRDTAAKRTVFSVGCGRCVSVAWGSDVTHAIVLGQVEIVGCWSAPPDLHMPLYSMFSHWAAQFTWMCMVKGGSQKMFTWDISQNWQP